MLMIYCFLPQTKKYRNSCKTNDVSDKNDINNVNNTLLPTWNIVR